MTTDHPRSRGVYRLVMFVIADSAGSSPLARGLRDRPNHGGHPPRIIPARAGFTQNPRWTSSSRRDHPRSRGVYSDNMPDGVDIRDHPRSRGVYGWADGGGPVTVGSSPLARGLRVSGPPRWPSSGIIPARAGFTCGRRRRRRRRRDHPRSRGVYGFVRDRRRHGRRIIPARAGFTDQGLG